MLILSPVCPGVAMVGSADDAEDVAFLHDEQVLAVEADLGARPFAEQDLVAGLDVERSHGAVLGLAARAGGDHLALLRLFLRGIRDDDPAGRLFFGLDTADQNPVVKRTEVHASPLLLSL